MREKRGPSPGVFGHAHEPSGHLTFEFVAGRKKCGVRSTVAERYSKPLRAAHGKIRAELTRRFDQGERQ